jgi:hypothetical protein
MLTVAVVGSTETVAPDTVTAALLETATSAMEEAVTVTAKSPFKATFGAV